MSFSIAGKTAIVTGAARGAGLAIARQFAQQGANVVFVDMDEETLTREVGPFCSDSSTQRMFAGDLRQRLTITNLLSFTADAFDRIDILVNAARQMMVTDPLNPDDPSVEMLIDQNLFVALHLSQAAAKRMIKHAPDDGPVGSIINLSSNAGGMTHPDLLGYSISIAALDQMTRSLATALAPKRIRVNAVAYGSAMGANLCSDVKDQEAWRSDITADPPLGRIASLGEVSEVVQYLASDESSFVTGQIISVDGVRSLMDAAQVPAK
jgi:7-alpha-hydroxysteroid dehydrogenase